MDVRVEHLNESLYTFTQLWQKTDTIFICGNKQIALENEENISAT